MSPEGLAALEEQIPGARWEPISRHGRVLVTREHGFNTDTILLADFAAPKRREACADFGTGCGLIPLLWQIRHEPAKIWGVELQEQAVLQAQRSVEENGFAGRVDILHGDVRQIRALFPAEVLDLVACNPPYQALGTGIVNADAPRRTARHEETLTLRELASSAAFALRFGGRLCICQRPERLADAAAVFREAGLEPKRLRLVQQRAGKAPSLFLMECRKGGKPGLRVEPVLFLEGENGASSAELEKIYGDYRENAGWKT